MGAKYIKKRRKGEDGSTIGTALHQSIKFDIIRAMRTTLTIEPDVAARLDECQAADMSMSFKELVNGLLRMALAQRDAQRDAAARKSRRRRISTRVFHANTLLPAGIASTHDMLEFAEGAGFR